MMRTKVKLLFACDQPANLTELDRRLSGEVSRLEAAFPGQISTCLAYDVNDASLLATAAGAFNHADRPFSAMLEVVSDVGLDRLLPVFEGLADRLSGIIDPADSAALVGDEYPILPGAGSTLVIIANRRLPQFTHEGFLKYWLDYHGPFTRKNTPPDAGFGYRQYHADPEKSVALLKATGLGIADFDGAAECYYLSPDGIRRMMGMTDVVERATIDERDFVDHEACVTSVFTIKPSSKSHLTA